MSSRTPIKTPTKTPTPSTPGTGGAALPPPGTSKTKNNSTISQSEITSILSACTNNFRFDGRSNLCTRPYTLLKTASSSSSSSPPSSNNNHQEVTPILSNGSSRIFLPGSNTDIICSIKAEIVHPPLYQTRDEGVIELNIDILPFASSSSSDRRNIRKEEMEVTSTLMHLLIPHLVDKEQLVVARGRYVWRLNIDVLVMQCDGNLMDVCSMAVWGAMQNVKLPNVVPVVSETTSTAERSGNRAVGPSPSKAGKKALDEIMLDGDIANAVVPKGVADCPIVITICLFPKYIPKIDDSTRSGINDAARNIVGAARNVSKGIDSVMVVDATRLEEACATTKVSVSVDPQGNICGVHKYGSSSVLLSNNSDDSCGGTIALSTLSQVQDAAVTVSKGVFEMIKLDSAGTSSVVDGTLGAFSNFFRGHFELQ